MQRQPMLRSVTSWTYGDPTDWHFSIGHAWRTLGVGGTAMGALSLDAQRVVEEQRLGYVATVNDDGTPNLSPKGTIAVLDDSHLAFCNIRSPMTIYNLMRRRAIEVNIVDPIGRKGYRFRGTATVIEQGEAFEELKAFYRERGSENAIEGVV